MNRLTSVKRTSARSLLAVLLCTGLMAGCDSGVGDLEQYIEQVKARPAGPIPPIPPVKTYTPYDYEGLTGRDPFRVSTTDDVERQVTSSGTGPQPDFDRPREYLERFELDTLEMVGTFEQGDNEWALVEDPDGTVHRVSVGNYLGKNHGKIVRISATEVALEELITDGGGGWLVREASMALE